MDLGSILKRHHWLALVLLPLMLPLPLDAAAAADAAARCVHALNCPYAFSKLKPAYGPASHPWLWIGHFLNSNCSVSKHRKILEHYFEYTFALSFLTKKYGSFFSRGIKTDVLSRYFELVDFSHKIIFISSCPFHYKFTHVNDDVLLQLHRRCVEIHISHTLPSSCPKKKRL